MLERQDGTVCKICQQPAVLFDSALVLQKHVVRYYRCGTCGFIQTESPYWLAESYSEAITSIDIGLVSRNLSARDVTRALILTLFSANGRFMDYGGGYGLFVRLMRDAGFDFYRFDPNTTNLFARHFEAKRGESRKYGLLTAFEVFEHLADPVEECAQMLAFSRNILFSTVLVPPHNPKVSQWWYYAPEYGQHIALYTKKSLEVLAGKFSLRLYSDGRELHLLTDKHISSTLFRAITSRALARAVGILRRRKSLQADDFFQITGRRIEEGS